MFSKEAINKPQLWPVGYSTLRSLCRLSTACKTLNKYYTTSFQPNLGIEGLQRSLSKELRGSALGNQEYS